jgi:hypothetical protein
MMGPAIFLQPSVLAFAPLTPCALSRPLLEAVLADRVSDRFVCELVWWRLGYRPQQPSPDLPEAPQVIATRAASVRLTRSIAAPHKQLLKQQLGFGGYRIEELFPRRTRRATAVNWLLAHLAEREEPLPPEGPLPPLLNPPRDPRYGHPGDPAVS